MAEIHGFNEYFTSRKQLEDEWDLKLNPIEPEETVIFGRNGSWPYIDGASFDCFPKAEDIIWEESELKLYKGRFHNSINVFIRGVTEWWMSPSEAALGYPEADLRLFPRRTKFLKNFKSIPFKVEIEKTVRYYSSMDFPDTERQRLNEEAKSFIRKTYREWPWETELSCRESYKYEGNEVIVTLQWYFSPVQQTHPKCI